jgi:hypothetical protein
LGIDLALSEHSTVGVGPGGLGIGANMSGDKDRAWCDSQAASLSGTDYDYRFRLLRRQPTCDVAFYPDVGGTDTTSGEHHRSFA